MPCALGHDVNHPALCLLSHTFPSPWTLALHFAQFVTRTRCALAEHTRTFTARFTLYVSFTFLVTCKKRKGILSFFV